MTEYQDRGPNYSNIRLIEYSNENPTTDQKDNMSIITA